MLKHAAIVAALLFGAGTAIAQDKATDKPAQKEMKTEPKSIGIGDRAPALTVGKWLKGEPVTGFEKGKPYVVEFWATWCGPCRVSIPHLTEMQKEFKDKGVTFIGVSVWESDPAAPAPFVKDMGEKMEYTVATDDVPPLPEGTEPKSREAGAWSFEHGKMSQAWMKGAGQGGIPTAFIVNGDGVIAWIGHPMDGLDKALEQVVSGKYDLEKAKDEYQHRGEKAKAAAKEAAALNKSMSQFQQKLLKDDDAKGAYEIANSVIDGAGKDNVMALNFIAWTIVDPENDIAKRDLDVALKAAGRADELTKHKDAAILDTLARVYWLKGEKSKARELQQKAVDLADDEMKDELKQRLDEYKAGK